MRPGQDPSAGWAPSPFRQILIKIHSRCNLACTYCYVYEHADQSWRERPRCMSTDTLDLASARIAEHVREHRLSALRVGLHGGEPLLAGREIIEYAVRTVRSSVPADTKVDFAVQTNGLLLDETFLDLFTEHGVTVGVSLDGGRKANDRHRRFTGGRGSYDGVARALGFLGSDRYRDIYAGLLCTIDVDNDPVGVYEDLLAFAPPQIDLLLPHGNWSTPPPNRPANQERSRYADWLIAVFDRWFDAPVRETRIRLFDSIVNLVLGLPSESEVVGLSQIDLITMETDGTLEQGDALKTVAEGAAGTGLTLRTNSLDEALSHPGVLARQRGLDALSATCRACPLVSVCGGGLYAHRFAEANGFDNPSVYCGDLAVLIVHIGDKVRAGVLALATSGFVAEESSCVVTG